jgi:threonine dehydrogenase-like Zn-dependent dehydrogenase
VRVAIYRGADLPVSIEEMPMPRPGEGQLLVKVGRCGICGSDISMTSGGAFDYALGCPLGHEYAGEVVELGRGVERLKLGDRVACIPNAGCGRCESCHAGRPIFCVEVKPQLGGFGEFVAVAESTALALPASLSLADGALVEPMACGRHALRLAGFGAGSRLLVLGAGAMALSIIYWARLQGAAEIIVASRSAHRRETVIAMGADSFHSFEEDDPAVFSAMTNPAPEFVAECIGKPDALQQSIGFVRGGGTVISMGMCMQGEPIIPALCAFKEVRLVFPLAYTIDDFEETARTFDAGNVDIGLMVSETVGLDELPEAFAGLRAGSRALKVHVDPTRQEPE